jgi:predicted dienelactone hydrolase
MKCLKPYLLKYCTMLCMLSAPLLAQEVLFGDPRPDAPELAQRGAYTVGVTTLELVNPDQVDILVSPEARYDRPLTVELYYPADLADSELERTEYTEVLGRSDDPSRPNVPFTFAGRAARDAAANREAQPYPLVIVSHGFPGSRFMMSYLNEHLASHGYVVAAIGHTESTFDDTQAFSSTLLNRSLDQLFVLDKLARLSGETDGLLSGLIDAEKSAIVGYSMGGYGALNSAGAGYSAAIVTTPFVPGGALAVRQAGNFTVDSRIKAVVAFAPWGGPAALAAIGVPGGTAFWDAAGLAELRVPSLFVAGSEDDVSGYDDGVRWLFERAVNSERYMLVYENARHNVAPNPPPAGLSNFADFERYAEFAWDPARINNINQHFVTAFLGLHLKDEDYRAYLESAVTGEFLGFLPRTAVGLTMLKGD